MSERVLIIDDEEAICWSLDRSLRRRGYETRLSSSAEEGLSIARDWAPHVCLLDVRLPGRDGLSVLEELKKTPADPSVIVMTAFGTLDTTVRSLAGGAFEYLPKPFELQTVIDVVARAGESHALKRLPNKNLPADMPSTDLLVGRSPAMQDVFRRIALAAPTSASVLILGESGTGKELVARAIHRYSDRRDRPFVAVNLAALNPQLVESELFGHVRGAFTGADDDRIGLFEEANGGTLFIDELADMPMSIQVKLLRVLEQREIVPVGANRSAPIDVRILSATHGDVTNLSATGAFRKDLLYRLDVFRIHVPTLAERVGDIPDLCQSLLLRMGEDSGKLTPMALETLEAMNWVGHVRELRNCLEQAVILSRGGPILAEHVRRSKGAIAPQPLLPVAIEAWLEAELRSLSPGDASDLHDRMIREMERSLMPALLRWAEGNRSAVARVLGLDRTTLRRKLDAES